jgi:CHAD domain-containing protein
MDRLAQLKNYSLSELVAEVKRRIAEADTARAVILGPVLMRSHPKMSEAKAAYWRAWHEYKVTHPDARVEQWRRAQKRAKK